LQNFTRETGVALSQENTRAAEEISDMFEYMYGYSHGKVLVP